MEQVTKKQATTGKKNLKAIALIGLGVAIGYSIGNPTGAKAMAGKAIDFGKSVFSKVKNFVTK